MLTMAAFIERNRLSLTVTLTRQPLTCARCRGVRKEGDVCPACFGESLARPCTGEDWTASAREYKVKLRASHVRDASHNCDYASWMTFPYFQGVGIEEEPSLAGVLESLTSDARSVENVTFEDWANDMGMDSDIRKAEKMYRQCCALGNELRRVLGATEFFALLYEVGD